MKQYHEQMLLETLGLQRLTNDLLDLSKLQNPEFPIERAEIVWQDVLSDALHAADQIARIKRIAIRARTAGGADRLHRRLRPASADAFDRAGQRREVLPGENGAIEVSLTKDRITVRDHGAGIAPDLLPFIFDRFRKTPSEENRQGSGLGLAIAKQIAARHGIEIDVESTAGDGTTFTFIDPGHVSRGLRPDYRCRGLRLLTR